VFPFLINHLKKKKKKKKKKSRSKLNDAEYRRDQPSGLIPIWGV